jgi:hypothetical protein
MSVCIYSVFMLSCMQVAAFRQVDPPSKESYRLYRQIKKLKSGQGPIKGCRAIDIFVFFFSYSNSGGWSPQGPLPPPSPRDYEVGEFGGMIIGKGNRSTRRKPAPMPLCPPQIPRDLAGREPGGKPATNRLSYGTAV